MACRPRPHVIASKRARVTVGADSYGEPVHEGLAAHFADRWSTVSAGIAVPVFAFFSAGVAVGGLSGLLDSFTDTIALGIIAGLVLGKVLGITGAAYLITRLRGVNLDPSFKWIDVIGMAFVAGIGFTVSLLVDELSCDTGSATGEHVKAWAGPARGAGRGAVTVYRRMP